MSEEVSTVGWRPETNCQLCRLGKLTVPCTVDDIRKLTYGGTLQEEMDRPPVRLYRNNVVQGEGPVPCPIMLIGEAPGFQEDREGRPFVESAPAGRVLARAMAEVGLTRMNREGYALNPTGNPDWQPCWVYLTNALKCRPEDNKIDRFPDALEVCRSTFLEQEIAQVHPKVIVCLGKVAALPFFGKQPSLAFRQSDLGTVTTFATDSAAPVLLIHAPHPSNIARGAVDNRPKLIEALRMAKEVGYGS